MTLDDILVAAYPVLPVPVIEQPDHAIPLAETLVAQGVRVLEITRVLTRCWRSSTPLPGGGHLSAGRAGIATKKRYAFGFFRQGFQRRPMPDAMPTRHHTR